MSADYLLGKDIASIQESLRRLEARSGSIGTCSCGNVLQGTGSLAPSIPPADSIVGYSRSISRPASQGQVGSINILWRATDEASVTKQFPPDGGAEYVLQAFMIPPNSPYDSTLDSLVQQELQSLCSRNVSGDPAHYYRPTNRRGQTCVLCLMNCRAGTYGWIAVEFSHCLSGSCAFSTTFDMNGNAVSSKWDWDPDYYFRDLNKYKINYHYADCDYEWGLGFNVGTISML